MNLRRLSFSISGAPVSVNKLYFNRGRRARILTPEGKMFKRTLAYIAREEMKRQKIKMTESPVSVDIKFFFKTRAGDVDNCIKSVLDSLSKVVWKDDKQVANNCDDQALYYQLRASKHKSRIQPRTEIEIKFYDEKGKK